MADEREYQEEPSQGSPANQPEASASGGNAQIANLMHSVEELTRKHNTQQSQMERISAENQGQALGAGSTLHPKGVRNTAHSPMAPM
ncbi:hypothetical protein TIFTF001_028436 [Ficus carica]|uniref:Uncharacterized protein n=1 Tax=Ficus carica TaxID=3494 RepID=A0AA88DPY2_FICCA|nr:hypothetical protein TIFTF001_028436 [Ficus carica]